MRQSPFRRTGPGARAACAAGLLALLVPAGATPAPAPAASAASADHRSFERAFPSSGPAASVRYRAEYRSRGGLHHVEAWRDGDRRLVRRTDDRVELYGIHAGTGPDFHLTVIDLDRRIRSTISRDHLVQIGKLMDWDDLAHALQRPVQGARAEPLRTPPSPGAGVAPVAPCRWVSLQEGERRSSVCWSARVQLPLLILDAKDEPVWRITSLQVGPIPAARFVPPTEGLVSNDADADISGD